MEIKFNNKDFTPTINNKSNNSQKEKGLNSKTYKKVSYSQLKDTINCKYMINDTKISYWKEKNEKILNKIRKEYFDILNKPEMTNYKSCIKYSATSNNKKNTNSNDFNNNDSPIKNNTASNLLINPFTGGLLKQNNCDNITNKYPDFLEVISEKTVSTIESTQTCPNSNFKSNAFEEKLNKFRKLNKKIASYNEQFQTLYKKIAKLK